MPSIQIHGKISPLFEEVTMTDYPIVSPETGDFNLSIDLTINKGIVLAVCNIDVSITDNIFAQILIAVSETASLAIDLIGFKTGRHMSLNLESATYEDGTSKKLFWRDLSLPAVVTSFDFPSPDFFKVIMTLGEEVGFLYAVRDLIDALGPRRGGEIGCAVL
jgi:hypothetical protein